MRVETASGQTRCKKKERSTQARRDKAWQGKGFRDMLTAPRRCGREGRGGRGQRRRWLPGAVAPAGQRDYGLGRDDGRPRGCAGRRGIRGTADVIGRSLAGVGGEGILGGARGGGFGGCLIDRHSGLRRLNKRKTWSEEEREASTCTHKHHGA